MLQVLNIAGYKFITLSELPALRAELLDKCLKLGLKGTILLSEEGINLNLAGLPQNVGAFIVDFQHDTRFADMTFRKSYSSEQPFRLMLVKVKKEIITMRQADVQPDSTQRAPSLSPAELKQWLDEGRDITLLDTRNHYEVKFGTFAGATHLNIEDFSEFPSAAAGVVNEKPVVMFCTGGIRCEKAALHLLNAGFSNVYQLDGGILNYFSKMGGAHYDGECFVFDQRIAVDPNLKATGTVQCHICQGPVTREMQTSLQDLTAMACLSCKNQSLNLTE